MIYCEKRDIITLKTCLHAKQMVRILKFLAWHAEIDNVCCSDVTSNLCILVICPHDGIGKLFFYS